MSAQIRYAYLKGHTWLYRRNYPRDVAVVLGSQALKQSLKTSDLKLARARAAEVNARYEATVQQVLTEAQSVPLSDTAAPGWANPSDNPVARLRATLEHSDRPDFSPTPAEPASPVAEVARRYLIRRRLQLRPGGYKSVRYSVELFASKYGEAPVSYSPMFGQISA